MADSKLITSIGEELECPVCADYFTDACFLSCMHSFCRACLSKCDKTYGRGGKSSMNCPMCRKVTMLGKNGVAGLLTDYTSNKLVTRLKDGIKERAAGYSQKDAMTCQNCRDGVVVSYCLSCCHFICATCHSIHSKLVAMKTHEVIPLKDLRKGNVTVVRTENPQFCGLHRLDTTCFCYTCQRYQCDLCCMLDRNRQGHSCTEPSHNEDTGSIAEKRKEVIQKAVERLSKKRSSIEEQKGEVKRMRASVKRHYGAMKDQLKSSHDLRLRTVTRVMKEKHDDLVKVIDDDQELMLTKIASVDETLGHTESRTLEAKSIGDNALKDGQHAEIAAVNEYLESVISSLDEDKSSDRVLKQIKQYADRVKLNPIPADKDVESLASLGHIFRPHVWEDTEVSGLEFNDETLRAICYNSTLKSFIVSSRNSISTIALDGQASHVFKFEDRLCVQDLAVDGITSYVLFEDNRIRVFRDQSWEKYTGVIELPGKGRESMLSSLAISDDGVVIVGDQASQTIVGRSSAAFKKMTDISPIKMTFTSSGELAVVCRNIRQVAADNSGSWNEAGVSVKIFGVKERRENVLVQNNWQAAAVASRVGNDDSNTGRFFAFGVYVLEDGSQLTSLAEYDSFGTKHNVVFEDKALPVDLESGIQPLIAADREGDTIAVYTGVNMLLFRRRDFSTV